MEAKRTLTVKELQQYLGIGRVSAYNLVNSEGFPSFRIGKKILINADALNEWMKRKGEKKHEFDS
jgi:excisionase family DNA binding protein